MIVPRTDFSILNFNFEVIASFCGNANDFADIWRNYLGSCGWTEEEWEEALGREIFENTDVSAQSSNNRAQPS